MIGRTQGRIQVERSKPVTPKPAAKAGRSVQATASAASASAGGGVSANRTGEHRIVSALGKASKASVSHTVTSSPQSATYAVARSRLRPEGQTAPPGAAQFALREAIGAGAAGDAEQTEEKSHVEEAAAEKAQRAPEQDVVERHRDLAVQKLEDLDDRARSEATEAGAVVPVFEFQVGPDARAYRVDFRDAPKAHAKEDEPSPTVDRQ